MGGDSSSTPTFAPLTRFNPRLRMGGDVDHLICSCVSSVSIHASAWEATAPTISSGSTTRSFNPRLRMGGDTGTKRARPDTAGFNPRLRMGGDRGAACVGELACAFQSTPPHGRRRPVAQGTAQEHPVSIHASAWEATSRPSVSTSGNSRFNPRLRMGGDVTTNGQPFASIEFQSTPPHGRRPARS